jgi:hypothetical protein
MRLALITLAAALVAVGPTAGQAAAAETPAGKPAQSRAKPPAGKTQKPAPARRIAAPAAVACPHVLGTGVRSKLQFCDVLTGRDPAEGVLLRLPPHKGVLTLTFDLHNRHTYSEELVKAGKAYAQYTATIGALTMDGTLIARGVVRSEFRTAKDLLDRIGGGAGPKGIKAVAPVGTERISIDVPQDVDQLSLLGEKLSVLSITGSATFTAAQRPIATISNVNIEYQPATAPASKNPVKKKY